MCKQIKIYGLQSTNNGDQIMKVKLNLMKPYLEPLERRLEG